MLQQQFRNTGVMPPSLAEKPEVAEQLQWVDAIFMRLSSQRRWDGMSGMPQAIEYGQLEAYLRLVGIEDEETRYELVVWIPMMDAEFRAVHMEKRSNKPILSTPRARVKR